MHAGLKSGGSETSSGACGKSDSTRITFQVNVWVHHHPLEARNLTADQVAALTSSPGPRAIGETRQESDLPVPPTVFTSVSQTCMQAIKGIKMKFFITLANILTSM